MLDRKYSNPVIFILILIIKNLFLYKNILIACKKDIFYKELKSFNTDLNETSIILKIEDDKMVATTDDNSLRIYDLKNDFKLLKTLSGRHDNFISSLIKLNNGDFASASWDKTIKIWDKTNKYSLKKTIEDDSEITSLLETNTGLFVTGYKNGDIKLWQSIKGFLNFTEHSDSVTCLVALKNGYLASGSKDKTIIIWDPRSNFSVVKTVTGHAATIRSMIVIDNGMIVTTSDDSTIKIWNPDNNFYLVKTLINHSKSVSSIVVLDSGLMASGSTDIINIWSTKDFSLIKSINSGDSEVTKLCYLQNKLFASGHLDGSIKIWSIEEDYNLITQLLVDSISLTSMISLKNGFLISGYSDGSIRVYDSYQNFTLLYELIMHTASVNSLLEIDNGMILSGSKDKSIKLWNPFDKFTVVETLTENEDGANFLLQLNLGFVISAYDDASIKIWKLNPITIQSGHDNQITDLKLLNKYSFLSSSLDKKINIHSLKANNKLIKSIYGHTDEVNKLEIINNYLFASASSDTVIKIWNYKDNYRLFKNLIDHTKSITSLLKLSNGVLLSGGNETRIKAWDIDGSLEEIQTIEDRTPLFLEVDEETIITISDESKKAKFYIETPIKHFYKHQDNNFSLNNFINPNLYSTSIQFQSISQCNSKIFIDSTEVKFNKMYDINTIFKYVGYCESNMDEIKFSYFKQNTLIKNQIITIFFENPPYLWQPISIVGEISKKYSIDFSDKIYDDVFSLTSLNIEFYRLPRFGILISDDSEDIKVNTPYQKLNFEYLSTSQSELDLFDSFEFRIINGYNLKSEVYIVEITLTPQEYNWSKPKIIIAIICSVIALFVFSCFGVYTCRVKRYCCWKEKDLKKGINKTILVDSMT